MIHFFHLFAEVEHFNPLFPPNESTALAGSLWVRQDWSRIGAVSDCPAPGANRSGAGPPLHLVLSLAPRQSSPSPRHSSLPASVSQQPSLRACRCRSAGAGAVQVSSCSARPCSRSRLYRTTSSSRQSSPPARFTAAVSVLSK